MTSIKRGIRFAFLPASVLVALSGCGSSSETEVDATRQALSSGTGAGQGSTSTAAQPTAIPGQVIVKLKNPGPAGQMSALPGRSGSAGAHRAQEMARLAKSFRGTRVVPLVQEGRTLRTANQRRALRSGAARVLPSTTALRDMENVFLLEVPKSVDVVAVAAAIAADPGVAYAHPNYEVEANYTPNDPFLASTGSWGQAEPDLWGLEEIGAQTAWDSARGAGVVVAVVDTGLDLSHPDIVDNLWVNDDEIPGNGIDDDANGRVDDVNGWDLAYDDADPTDHFGHGTHVSGTVAAQDDNGQGIVGVAPDAKIMAVKGLDDNGSGSFFTLAQSLLYAADNGADVINNSWGCRGGCGPQPVIDDAIAASYEAGSVIVFSAGNDSQDIRDYDYLQRSQVIVVSALNPADEPASFTNTGILDVGAPGAGAPDAPIFEPERGILSLKASSCSFLICPNELLVGDGYLRQAGTSMAAPHVSGLAALILSQHPDYTQEQVRQAIRHSSVDVGVPGYDEVSGYGRIDAAAALQELPPLEALLDVPTVIDSLEVFDVAGIADGPGFRSYTLESARTTDPDIWTGIATSTTPTHGDTLASWTVGGLVDGDYVLRLTARTNDGRQYEDRALVTLDRIAITEPAEMTYLGGGAPIEIVGTAPEIGLDHYEIHVLRLADGTELTDLDIALTNDGQSGVENDVLGVWTPTGVPADHYRIVLTVVMDGGESASEFTRVVVDNSLKPGWPLVVNDVTGFIPFFDHAILADLDGDGAQENVVAYSTKVHAYRSDGSELPGWPQRVSEDGSLITWTSPAVGDVDGDHAPEVVVATSDGQLWVWNADGSLLPGWPRQRSIMQGVSLADVNGDHVLDMVLTTDSGQLDVVTANGRSLRGFPVQTPAKIGDAAVVADLDADGDQEVVVYVTGTNPAQVRAYSHRGELLPGFPVSIQEAYWEDTYPVVGDLDDDGDLEIAVTAVTRNGPGYLFALHHDGQPLAGWPRSLDVQSATSPVLADLDGDGSLEYLVGTAEATGRQALYVLNQSGDVMPGWPVRSTDLVWTNTPSTAPIVFDIDGDGKREVMTARVNDYSEPGLPTLCGFPLRGFRFDGTPVTELDRPMYGVGPFYPVDGKSPGVGDTDGDGLLELVWFEERIYLEGTMHALAWDLDVPASAAQPWPMFRGDARHSAVAEHVVPIIEPPYKGLPYYVDGVARFRITTQYGGVIQINHPWQANVEYAIGTDAYSDLPFEWGGPIQLQPHTEYLLRVKTTVGTTINVDWW